MKLKSVIVSMAIAAVASAPAAQAATSAASSSLNFGKIGASSMRSSSVVKKKNADYEAGKTYNGAGLGAGEIALIVAAGGLVVFGVAEATKKDSGTS